VLDAFE
jgi:hypothetical protein